jgi:UDP-N-acetylmuramoyl-L-alanyl-D-glutamate--2,6-diaminopimelate ligase
MVKNVKSLARKVLNGKVLRVLEDEYRLARASFANARFNWPAKGMRVIMITGTNGKTTTAHFLFSILREAGYSVGLSSTAEFRINEQVQANDTNMTVVNPVKLREQIANFKNHNVDFVILEATSQALDQHRLYGIPCEVAIFTNLTQDHLDYHKSMDAYARAKARLWQDFKPKISILNLNDEWYEYFRKFATGNIKTYGLSKADVTISNYSVDKNRTQFTLGLKDGKSVVSLQLTGKYNALNAAAAATAAQELGVKGEDIEKGIESLQALSGRLQEVQTKKPYKVLVDYAHTPDGLEKVLGAVKELTNGSLWLVFGACGDRDKSKRPKMGKIAARLADKIIVTDEESYNEDPDAIRASVIEGIKSIKNAEKKMLEIADRKKAIKYALDNAKKGDTVLITGLGHEQFRIQDGKRLKWNDAEVVKRLSE